MSRIGSDRLFRTALPVVALAALLALAWPGLAAAQDTTRDWNRTGDPLEGAIGLHYGQVGGHGLAFRLPVRWWLYVQGAGGIWHTADHKRHNVGLDLNYILRQDQRLRLYLSAGVATFYHREKVGTEGDRDVFATGRDWNVGGGVGLEILQGGRWSWKIEADFAHLDRSGDIKVIPQAGLFYYW